MALLSVKEVAKVFNVSSQTIRTWTQRGILKSAYKTPTNRVYYDEVEVNKVKMKGYEQEDDNSYEEN